MKPGFIRKMTGITLVLTLFAITSCTNTKKIVYFPNVQDGAIPSNIQFPESVIQKNDILSITVSSLNPEATAIFNSPNVTESGMAVGYLVNSEGDIQFPVIGNVKAEGLTKNQLKEKISKNLVDAKQLVDPIVSIRFINFRVTVLGEVTRPTVVSVPNEKISLLEAIGLAGDLTIYGRRQNVMIIREEKDQKIIKRVNLNSDELLTSPYYYLQSNDIVYVEPTKAKIASASRSMQWISVALSALSLAVIFTQRN